MAKLIKRTVIGVKQETSQGTVIALTATDYLLAQDVTVKPSIEMNERAYYRNSLDTVKNVPGKRWYELTFKTEIKGSGTAGTVYAPLGALIETCGLLETISAGVSVTYAPVSAPATANYYGPGKSVTASVYYDGVYHSLVGCMAKSAKLVIEAGKIAMLEITLLGLYADPTDAGFPATQTYLAQLPVAAGVVAANLTVHSFSMIAGKIEIDFGLELAERTDLRTAGGIVGYQHAGRKPTMTIDPEFDSVSNFNFFNKLSTGAEAQSSFVIGGTAGNINTFTLPKTQFKDLSYGSRNGIRTLEAKFDCNQSSGDDWISWVQT